MDLPLDVKGKRPAFFDDPAIDCVMTALLEALAENWTLKERLLALEKALVEGDVLSKDAVEKVEWTPEEAAQHELMRQRVLNDAFRALDNRFQSISARKKFVDSGSLKEDD